MALPTMPLPKRGQILQMFEDANGNETLAAKNIIAAAKDPTHPLYNWLYNEYFEWDDAKWGERGRMAQARALIRSVTLKVEFEDLGIRVPKYVRDPDKLPHEQGYKAITHIRDERGAALEFLRNGIEDIRRAIDRAQRFAIFLNLQINSMTY